MRRRRFLQLPVVASAIATARPAVVASGSSEPVVQTARTSVLIKAERDRDERPFNCLDATFHVKVSGKDTEGRCVGVRQPST